ncbi:hypothetical protein N9525_06110 [Flavobacteriaceae bacterium]|nr:hypothetical protein [Flavobacteriaceae bacterium]
MKKGLLSLLAVALTIVSCQNYDDQFAELTGLVNTLSTDVAGLSQVQTDLGTLSTLVASLKTAIDADFTTIEGDIETLEQLLTSVADSQDLGEIVELLDGLREDVNTLLEADAVINQNVTINNSATLEYVSTLISSAVDDPNVIINGSVTIKTTGWTPAITDTELAEVNAIAAKLATVLGSGTTDDGVTVTSATSITFTNLTFIDDDYTVTGADMADDALRTVTGDLTASHGGAAVAFDYSQLASIGGDLIIAAADAATATSIDISNVAITGTVATIATQPGNLTFPAALSVDLGTAKFHKLTANKASSIVSGMTTTASLTIVAANGGTINVDSLTEVTGTGVVVLTGTSTSVFHLDGLTDADGTITSSAAGEVHLPSLTAHGVIDINATAAVALTSLVTTTANIDLNTTPAAFFTALKEVDHTLTWNVGVINIPNANIDAAAFGLISSSVATDVTVKAIDAITNIRGGTGVTKLVLTGQDTDLGPTGDVTNLTVTADGAGIDVAAAGAVLTDVSLSGTEVNSFATTLVALKTITLNDTATNTLNAITGAGTRTVNLSGTLFAFTSTDTGLEALNNTATFLDVAPPAATPITIDIQGSGLVSVDLSLMEKVATARFIGNSDLTTLIAPTGATNLLTPGGGPTIEIYNNSIVATYTGSTAAFAGDGINPPTAYVDACIYSPSLATWKDYIIAVSAVDTVTYVIDAKIGGTAAGAAFTSTNDGYGEALVADDTNTHHDGTGGGAAGDTINNAEVGLVLLSATACD